VVRLKTSSLSSSSSLEFSDRSFGFERIGDPIVDPPGSLS
jgi:hypothetical protein